MTDCFVSTCDVEDPHVHIMPVEDILKLYTCEIYPDEWHQWYLDAKRNEYAYVDFDKSVRLHGFQPGFAPEIIDNEIYEGHHRITWFYDNSYWCPWQDTVNSRQYFEVDHGNKHSYATSA